MAEQDIPMYRVIIAATLVFIIGLFVFTIIFRAWLTFQELEQVIRQSGEFTEDESTLIILGGIPWALGGIYVTMLGGIIYFLLRSTKPQKKEIPPSSFRKR